MGEIAFRYAASADVGAIHALVERVYRGPEARAGWTSEADLLSQPRTSLAEVAGLIADDNHRFVLGERDGKLVACAMIERRGEAGYFGMLSVDPAVQTAGIGRALLAQLETSVGTLWKCNVMTLYVINLRHELIAWYERRGYVQTGRHHPFPFEQHPASGRDDFDVLEMRKAL
ncbi:MAG: family N-acetyltransferase [Devosia sp.]|uniref:GNAT family N-acetyltransferase n=1 Tax=Devosia sp. TaxID=1871048 RepID=UPI00260FDCF7|nr:GNAT family N-acetyltransferase [Devosia sp.]MDB5528887.1 family N-acetyltransferase [Devosia sp.]